MSFAPENFYHLASDLYNEARINSCEAKQRTVVSRSYYGAFLAARDASTVSAGSANVHQDVINYYFNVGGKAAVANWLKSLRRMRNDADYDLITPCTANNSGQSLKNSLSILKNLGVLP